MGSESALWVTARDELQPFGILERVENRVFTGMADVNYLLRRREGGAAEGWVEMKYDRRWPVRGGLFRSSTITLDQVNWLEARSAGGGRAWVLLQVHRDYLLLGGPLARLLLAGIAKDDLIGRAAVYAQGAFPTAKVLKCLTA